MSKYKKGDMFVVEITDNNCKVGLVNVISLIPKALAISYIKTRLLYFAELKKTGKFTMEIL